jgi:hypothetical protein
MGSFALLLNFIGPLFPVLTYIIIDINLFVVQVSFSKSVCNFVCVQRV